MATSKVAPRVAPAEEISRVEGERLILRLPQQLSAVHRMSADRPHMAFCSVNAQSGWPGTAFGEGQV